MKRKPLYFLLLPKIFLRAKLYFGLGLLMAIALGCRPTKERVFIRQSIPTSSQIALIIEGDNDVKNSVYTEFLKAGYRVKAMNANDFYTLDDVFESKDLKKIAIEKKSDKKSSEADAIAADKMFANLYRLHLYNFESSKADMLQELRLKYNIEYLLLLQLKEWSDGYSWARAIKLDTMDIWYVHNYPTGRTDSVQDIVARVLQIMKNGS